VRDQCGRQHGDAIFLTLSVAHQELMAVGRDVLYPQLQALKNAQPRAVEQACDQPLHAVQLREHATDLLARQHDRPALRTAGADNAVEPWQFNFEHFPVQEQDRR
jgi:hypothetical protein